MPDGRPMLSRISLVTFAALALVASTAFAQVPAPAVDPAPPATLLQIWVAIGTAVTAVYAVLRLAGIQIPAWLQNIFADKPTVPPTTDPNQPPAPGQTLWQLIPAILADGLTLADVGPIIQFVLATFGKSEHAPLSEPQVAQVLSFARSLKKSKVQ